MLASIFDPLMKRVLDEANDSNDEKVQTSVPDVKEMSPKEASEEVTQSDLVPAVVGEGKKVIEQSQTAGTEHVDRRACDLSYKWNTNDARYHWMVAT